LVSPFNFDLLLVSVIHGLVSSIFSLSLTRFILIYLSALSACLLLVLCAVLVRGLC
jgi:hypothetical protein